MAKAVKQKSQNTEDEITKPDDDNVIAAGAAFDDANANAGSDAYYADDGTDAYYANDSIGDADVDCPPDDAESAHDDGDALVTPKQLKILRAGGDRLQRPISYMKLDDHYNYLIKDTNVYGAKLLAALDWVVVQRTLFIKGKGVQCKGYRLAELEGPIPRPDTFTDRTKWAGYHKNGKEWDPWGNISTVLALIQASGGVIAFQADSPEARIAIGRLLKAFDGRRRPIVELTHEKNPDSPVEGAKIPVLRIVGYADKNEDFSFLREMLIRDDPEYPEPKESGSLWGSSE